MTKTEFLREQTISGANKCRRTPIAPMSVADESLSIAERKALVLKRIFENMPVYIGPGELIVGTRTFFAPNKGNEDGHDAFQYGLYTRVPYLNDADIELFGRNQSYKIKRTIRPISELFSIRVLMGLSERRKAEKRTRLLKKSILIFFLRS